MSRNPFEHHHPHHHDDPRDLRELDPAQQAFSDALRVSFTVLKVVMAILVIVYIFSGFFTVKENEVAVRLIFGRIVGETAGEQVVERGLHWGLPYPIQEVVKVDKSLQTLALNKAFWYDIPPGQEGRTAAELSGGPLDPVKDGSLLTGDANILHARFSIKYQVREADVVDFIRNVGTMDRAQELVRRASEQAIVHVAAGMTADELIRLSKADDTNIAQRAQASLDTMQTGIEIVQVEAGEREVPLEVYDAFQASSRAAEEAAQEVRQAEQAEQATLAKLAGDQASRLLQELVDAYELADEAERKALDQKLDEVIYSLEIKDETGRSYRISGEVARLINDARADAARIREEAESNAREFERLLAQYQANRDIVIMREWADVFERLFGEDSDAVMYWNHGRPYIEIGPTQEEISRRAAARLKAREEAREQAREQAENAE